MLGGGGFIGSAIADRLLLEGHIVTIFDRPRAQPYRAFGEGGQVKWIHGDMLSRYDVEHAVDGADVVLHLVSTTIPKSSNEDPIYDVESNLIPALHLFRTLAERRIGKIVFISSGGTIYGHPSYIPIDEKHPTNPLVSYGITKLAIEKYLVMYQHIHGVKAISLRVSNPFGERQRMETGQGAVGVFLHRALRNLPIEIWGDGSVIRDYLYIGDVADAFAKAVRYDGPESVFNIGSGTGTSLTELVRIIGKKLGREVRCEFKMGRAIDVPVNVLDNSLAARELGWRPEIGLDEGIERTLNWMRMNPAMIP